MVISSSVFTMRASPTAGAVTTAFADLTQLDALRCSDEEATGDLHDAVLDLAGYPLMGGTVEKHPNRTSQPFALLSLILLGQNWGKPPLQTAHSCAEVHPTAPNCPTRPADSPKPQVRRPCVPHWQ